MKGEIYLVLVRTVCLFCYLSKFISSTGKFFKKNYR